MIAVNVIGLEPDNKKVQSKNADAVREMLNILKGTMIFDTR